MYCEATLEVRLTFCAVEKFRYKNLHFVLLFLLFHPPLLVNEGPKKCTKIAKILLFHEDVPFDT